MVSRAIPQPEPVLECKFERERNNDLVKSSLWWDRYDREHAWTHTRRVALERDGKCTRCGSDGKPPQAELDKLGPLPEGAEARNAWQVAREKLSRPYGLTVVHRTPVAGDPFKDGCWNHPEHLLTLCKACAA